MLNMNTQQAANCGAVSGFGGFPSLEFETFKQGCPVAMATPSIICEVWFSLSCILDQIPKIFPINRSTDLEVLRDKFDLASPSNPTGRSDLPINPDKEPPQVTANTIYRSWGLIILGVDFVEPVTVPNATWMADGTHWPGNWAVPSEDHAEGDHAGILQVNEYFQLLVTVMEQK
ncbi:unnamed protein product [Coffea canephora]|uniref:Uncharacterized protein n=1 Tax=Coffea canephora TaxID=49390 RepID=A0A068VB13_COFCA|nr:unnamed protein product [Coffea canephora]